MRVERFEHEGELLGVLISGSAAEDGFQLVGSNEDALQVGRNSRPAGYYARAHYHPPSAPAKLAARQEMLHVLSGRIRVDLFTIGGGVGPSFEACAGDTVFLRAGHAVTFIERSELLELKQGPYPGPAADKIWLS